MMVASELIFQIVTNITGALVRYNYYVTQQTDSIETNRTL